MGADMLHSFKKASILGMAMGWAALSGCASGGRPEGRASHALMCPTCQTVWMTELKDQGMKTQRMVAKPGMICPDCDAMATAYLQDGKLVLHNCDRCKVTPSVLTSSSDPTHAKGTH